MLRDLLQALAHGEMTLADLSDELRAALRQHLRLSPPDPPLAVLPESQALGLSVALTAADDQDEPRLFARFRSLPVTGSCRFPPRGCSLLRGCLSGTQETDDQPVVVKRRN